MLDEIGAAAGNLHPQVARIVNGIAKLAFDHLLSSISVDNIIKLTPEQVINTSLCLHCFLCCFINASSWRSADYF